MYFCGKIWLRNSSNGICRKNVGVTAQRGKSDQSPQKLFVPNILKRILKKENWLMIPGMSRSYILCKSRVTIWLQKVHEDTIHL